MPLSSLQDYGYELQDSTARTPAEIPVDLQLYSQFNFTPSSQWGGAVLTDATTPGLDTIFNFNPSLGGVVDNNIASHTDTETSGVITTPQYFAPGEYTYFSDGTAPPPMESLGAVSFWFL